MRYLITGSQGFVGRYLTAALLRADADARIFGVGRSTRMDSSFAHCITVAGRERRAPLPSELAIHCEHYTYAQVDVLDATPLRQCLDTFRPDIVFHLASALRDDDSNDSCNGNVTGAATLVSLLDPPAMGGPKLIFGSTGGVYGLLAECDIPVKETAVCHPIDTYSASKLVAEDALMRKARDRGIDVVVARIFNIVGPGQNERHVCGRFAAQLCGDSASITVQSLERTRDFIDVRDVAQALVLLARSAEPNCVYNVASGVETRIETVLETLIRLAGRTNDLTIIRSKHQMNTAWWATAGRRY